MSQVVKYIHPYRQNFSCPYNGHLVLPHATTKPFVTNVAIGYCYNYSSYFHQEVISVNKTKGVVAMFSSCDTASMGTCVISQVLGKVTLFNFPAILLPVVITLPLKKILKNYMRMGLQPIPPNELLLSFNLNKIKSNNHDFTALHKLNNLKSNHIHTQNFNHLRKEQDENNFPG